MSGDELEPTRPGRLPATAVIIAMWFAGAIIIGLLLGFAVVWSLD